MHEVHPDEFIILAQLFAAIDDLAVADHGDFHFLHEHPGDITIAAVEER